MSFVTAAVGLAGSLLGGGGSSAPPPPLNNTANFGAVSFGSKFIGDEAVDKAASIQASTATGGLSRWLPWVLAGLAAVVALVFALRRPRRKK